jgi:xanthine dehydrogenase YagS FAD-binding subunit
MQRFEWARPATLGQARELRAEKPGSVFKAGGVDLIDHLKEHLVEPPRVVDLKSIAGLDQVVVDEHGGLRLGPLVTLAKVADHAGVRRTHPALAAACGEAASPQVRNLATLGGNVLQRPRCWYYRLESYKCLKKGGDVCYAVAGENRYHVIFGGGPSYAAHPSNAALALVAYGATFVLEGTMGRREVAAGDFFTAPARDAERENQMAPDELLVELRVPATDGWRSAYDEVRERAAFDWPLVSVAAALRFEGHGVREARIVLGAVAPIPWRSARAEQALAGRPLDAAAAEAAARAATVGAAPLSDNGYKVGLVQALVRRTLLSLA